MTPTLDSSQGVLFQYSNKNSELTAFSNKPESKKGVVLVGGLSNCPMGIGYGKNLRSYLASRGWSLIEIFTSSSGSGWGTGSVRRDANEIAELVEHLANNGLESLVLLGHSTGTQDLTTLAYLWKHEPNSLPWTSKGTYIVKGIALQAAVSDRDILETMVKDIEKTWVIPEGYTEKDAVPFTVTEVFAGPDVRVTYKRWKSLAAPPPKNAQGKYIVNIDESEDYFSRELPQYYREELFSSFQVPVAFYLSEKDETYPKSFTVADVQALLQSFNAAVPEKCRTPGGVILKGNHNLKDIEPQNDFFPKFNDFLEKLN